MTPRTVVFYAAVVAGLALALILITAGARGLAAPQTGPVPSTYGPPVVECVDGSWVFSADVCQYHEGNR